MDFDFDSLAQLAQRDPIAFEALRKEMIEEMIKGIHPDSQRLMEGFQFKIDMERRKSKNPMGACIRLSNMLKEQFYTDFYPAIASVSNSNRSFYISAQKEKKGEIIPFRKRAKE